MRVDKEKTFELLRTYSLTLERSMNENCSLYRAFSNIILDNETSLTIDDYNQMIGAKIFYTSASILYYHKDTFQKGFNNFDDKNSDIILRIDSDVNKKCKENYTIKDIIIYTRNAFAHFKNDLYEIDIDDKNLIIKIKLMNTICSKGPNKGKNIPFELELDITSLLLMAQFVSHFANTLNISGVDFENYSITNNKNLDIIKMLKEVIDSTFYTYTLFKQISDKDKKDLYSIHFSGNQVGDMSEYNDKKKKHVRKDEKIHLSKEQKKCIFESMSKKIIENLKQSNLTPDLLYKRFKLSQIKELLGIYMQEFFEYEALKVIPMGREKVINNVLGMMIASYGKKSKNGSIQQYLAESIQRKGKIYEILQMYCNINEKEEKKMVMNNIFDSSNIINESLSQYYGFVFENFCDENEIIEIDGIEYKVDLLRNSFIHGRWYFDEQNECWHLFDNKDSLKKPDQYLFDRNATISKKSLAEVIEKIYQEKILTKKTKKI